MLRVVLFASVASVTCLPLGFSTFFEGTQCPPGWKALPVARGRLIVSVTDSSIAGVTVNPPLGDREDRTHSHPFTTSIHIPEKDVAAIDCCNNDGGHQGDYPVVNQTLASHSGYPFSQLLLCTFTVDDDQNLEVAFGSVGYFDPSVSSCPAGWVPMQAGNGRILVPGYESGGVVSNDAAPLKSGEDRKHAHAYNISIQLGDTSYAGVEGCCNHDTASSTEVFVQGSTDEASAGLPFVQLLTCVTTTPSFNTTLPTLARVFNSLACPPGWVTVNEVSGRFVVPLPVGGSPGASFGGDSLPADPSSNSSNPKHSHDIEGLLPLPPAGVGLAAGCCGDGYAKASTYFYSGASAAATDDLPYTMLPLCERADRVWQRAQENRLAVDSKALLED
eukprot:c6210_g1_i1.p1 GENE.c6210_g1_i1~~c6210_g1_i1.p1  ORF type:complete len:389 (-),score=55.81 c6210_g1_i1:31-1197(-)